MILTLNLDPEQGECSMDHLEQALILHVLKHNDWSQRRSAVMLGISTPALNAKIVKYGIHHNHWRVNRVGPFVPKVAAPRRRSNPYIVELRKHGVSRSRAKLLQNLAHNSLRLRYCRSMGLLLIAKGLAEMKRRHHRHAFRQGSQSLYVLSITDKGREVAKQLAVFEKRDTR